MNENKTKKTETKTKKIRNLKSLTIQFTSITKKERKKTNNLKH